MWDKPLIKTEKPKPPPKKTAKPKAKPKPKAQAKAKTPTVAKLQREIKALQTLTKQQDLALKQLSETVSRFTEQHERLS